jgi:hypothetical protein
MITVNSSKTVDYGRYEKHLRSRTSLYISHTRLMKHSRDMYHPSVA